MAMPSLLQRLNITPQFVSPKPVSPRLSDDQDHRSLQRAAASLRKESNAAASPSTGASSDVRVPGIPEKLWNHLYAHQKAGVHWLVARISVGQSCILADDMGLGKTLQAIACLVQVHGAYCTPERDAKRITNMQARAQRARAAMAAGLGILGAWQLTASEAAMRMPAAPLPSLVVVPNSVVAQWCSALHKWSCTGLSVLQLTSSSASETVADVLQAMIDRSVDVVVTTHSCVAALAARKGQHRRGGVVAASLASVPIGVLVVDEAHNCTATDGVGRSAIQALDARVRLLLTGTAVSHGAGDLLALLDFGCCLSDSAWMNLFRRLAEHGVRSAGCIFSTSSFRLDAQVSVAEYGHRVQTAVTRRLRLFRAPESAAADKARAGALAAELERCAAPHVLRRSKASVLAQCLPRKHAVVLFCALGAEQQALYAATASDATAHGIISEGLWRRVFALYKRMASTHGAADFLKALGRAVSSAVGGAFADDPSADEFPQAPQPAPARPETEEAVGGAYVWQQPQVQAAAAAESVHLDTFVAFLGSRISPATLQRRVAKGETLVRQVTLRKAAQGAQFLQPAMGCTPLQARLESSLAAAIAAQARKQPSPAQVAATDSDAGGSQTSESSIHDEAFEESQHSSSKMEVLLQIMASLFAEQGRAKLAEFAAAQLHAGGSGHAARAELPDRLLIFSHSVRVLDFIREHLRRAGYTTVAIDGRDGRGDSREAVVAAINDPASGVHAACISTTAGGEGLNLTGANIVVHWDLGFSPAKQRQAQDRAYRLGQRRDVLVLSLVAQGTIEETMLYRQITKEWEARLLLDGQANDAFIRQKEVFGEGSLWRYAPRGFFKAFRKHWLQLREQGILAPDASLLNLCMGPVQTSTYAGLLESLLQHPGVAAWLDCHAVEHRGGGDPPPQAGSAAVARSKRPRLFSTPAPRLLSRRSKAPRTAPAPAVAACAAQQSGPPALGGGSTAAPSTRQLRVAPQQESRSSAGPAVCPAVVPAAARAAAGANTSGQAGDSPPVSGSAGGAAGTSMCTMFDTLRAQVSLQLD